jgi:hypothetical protein
VTIEFFTSLNAGDLNSNFFIDDIFLCNDQPNAVGPRCQSPVVASSRLGAETRGGSDSEVIGETFGTIEKGEIIVP